VRDTVTDESQVDEEIRDLKAILAGEKLFFFPHAGAR